MITMRSLLNFLTYVPFQIRFSINIIMKVLTRHSAAIKFQNV